jgi:LuxR family maltose regulon positive regulatory protein
MMAVSLLQTKLHIPHPRPDLVPRPRLVERLNQGLRLGRRLTLVSAPAGFGKTTLLSEWVATVGEPVVWLSLDEGDNDPARFLTYLVAALQGADSTVGRGVQAMLQGPQPPPPEALLTSLINDVAAMSNPLVLILDDYHLIHTLPIHQQLAFLLAHMPSQMHLVIASREDPPLPLSRLRARGQMVEVRQADLTFTAEESVAFLRRTMGLELSSTDAAALQRRTEGWIAGLQLAALSLRGSDDVGRLIGSFAGSHRYVLDYLIDEVFARQPARVQDFLLKSSILDRLTASLCDAVRFGVGATVTAEGDGSREILHALDQANLFIVPLDASREWYRFHRLFADLLRQQLRRGEMGALVPELHRRASRWYEGAGFPGDAVNHALAASDWGRAAALIMDQEERMLRRGEVVTLLGWLQALPDEALRSRPQLYLSYSWALILTGQLDAAESTLAEAEMVAQDHGAGDGPAPLMGDIVAAQAFIARTRGDDARTIELSPRALSLLSEDDLAGRSIVALNLGIAHWSSGHLAEAEEALREAERAARQSRNHYASLTALSFLGVVHAAQGRLHQAAEWLREAIRAGGGSPPTALAHDSLSALLYEWNDLEAAVEHSERGIELGARSGNVEIQIGGYRNLARLRQARGDPSAALDALQKAHRLAREKDVSPLMRARNAACHVRIALAQDDLPTAIRWAEQVTEDADSSRFYPLLGLTPARLLLAQGEKAAAAWQLAAWREVADRSGWQFGAIEVRALQALAAPTLDDALDLLTDALTLAEPEGYVRTFVDKGQTMAELLQETGQRGLAPAYARMLLGAFSHPPAPPRPAAQRLVEPLSERELEVLPLLADGLTYQEIAQALFISVNTVKTHLKNVYGKLGVHDRQEAVARARELDLLP